MKNRAALVALMAFLPWLAASCHKSPTVYQVKGVVREVLPDRKTVKIAHEKIPGYMAAMTMDFSVTNAAELNGLQPGDLVSFRMSVTDDDGWIDQIKKTGATNAPVAPPPEMFRRARIVEPLAVGDPMPDYKFTNQLGRLVNLKDFNGQAYVINFIFTRCPFPTFCPRQSKGLSDAQEKLKSTTGGPTNWHFLSITIDPAFDTLPRLKGYGSTYHADPTRWSFLTGDLEDITAIGEQFGLQIWRDSPDALPNHNVRTIVIDAAGRVQWVTNQNEWKADDLVEQILKAAQVRQQ
jgi:protein SCO1/2